MNDLLGQPVITAAEMDAMTPQQRRAAFRSRVVRDLSELPEEYVARLRATAQAHLAEREAAQPGESDAEVAPTDARTS